MSKNSILFQNIQKLRLADLKRLTKNWEVNFLKDKESNSLLLYETFQKEFYLKGILEKLSPLQSAIYTHIIENNCVLTLGDISRKTKVVPNNVELELKTLINYHLVYQRKDRERLTINLDKYYAYEEIANVVPNKKNTAHFKDLSRYTISLYKYLSRSSMSQIDPDWVDVMGLEKKTSLDSFLKLSTSDEGFKKSIDSLSEVERNILSEIYLDGGIIVSNKLRQLIVFKTNKKNYEKTIFKFLKLHLLIDICFLEEKFHRVFVIPTEFLNYLNRFPLIPKIRGISKKKQKYTFNNQLDFFLNLKLLISYISRKGISLAKSDKVKQIDNKRSEEFLLRLDLNLFPEKSQIYQMDIILPILRLLNVVDIKDENVILIGPFEDILKKDIISLMEYVCDEIRDAKKNKRSLFLKTTVFTPVEIPFYDELIFRKCIKKIKENQRINLNTLFSSYIRDELILSNGFLIKDFEDELNQLKKELLSALFYLNVFGLIDVEYPDKYISFSDLGKYLFEKKPIDDTIQKGAVIINADFSLIAFPDRISLRGLHLLKIFTDFEEFDGVYKFRLTQTAYQNGILLGYDPKDFLAFLKQSVKSDIAQNILFFFEEWKKLPMVDIIEDCVLIKSKDSSSIQSLLSKIKGKKIRTEEITDNVILIDKKNIDSVIQYAEKLDLVINLVRK